MTELTAAQKRVLDIISAEPAGLRLSALCKRLGRTRYSVETHMRVLRDAGLAIPTHPRGSKVNRWCTPATIDAGRRAVGAELREAERERKAQEWRAKVARQVESFADYPTHRRVRMSESKPLPIMGPNSVFALGAWA